MGWSIGYDSTWRRDIGYGVPATCDHPGCGESIDRGLGYVCAHQTPYGGEHGCGLFFCGKHANGRHQCERCAAGQDPYNPFEPTPDIPEWVEWKLTHESWQRWRDENPEEVARMRAQICAAGSVVNQSSSTGEKP